MTGRPGTSKPPGKRRFHGVDGPGWRVGSRFGPYELRSLLGKGGMGEVYEAYDTVKDRVVAVKLLPEELAKDPVYQVRFRRESQAAARLAEPHIIPIHDWGVIDGVLFIDMRLVPGVDLRSILRGQGPMSAERALGIVEQIAAALDAAHADGLVHRDVKPANILVTDADFAYLADFGIAHTEGDSTVTQVGMAVGSYIYMAPERFDVGTVTGRADIYSLACVLHECLTGATPFPAGSMNVLIRSHLTEPPPRPSVQRPGVPPGLDEVIARGMAKDPGDRFPTAIALAQAARAALSTGPAPSAPTFVVRAPDPSRFGQSDSATAQRSAVIPPEATGEISIIHPTAPTVVRPSDIQFTPLPSQSAPAGPTPPTPVRPFPDEHLYPEGQRYSEATEPPRYPAPQTQRYGQIPAVSEGVAPQTQRYGEVASVSTPYGQDVERFGEVGPLAQQYAPDVEQFGEVAAQTQRYGAPERRPGAPGHPGTQAYSEYRQEPAAQGQPFPAAGGYDGYDPHGNQGYRPGEYDEDYGRGGYESPESQRSIVLPILVAVLIIVVIAVGGAVGWSVLGSPDQGSGADNRAGATVTSASPRGTTPGGAAATTAAPTTTSSAPTSVTLPAGAKSCSTGQPAPGTFTQSAAGSEVTSCPFAEAVRQAYAQSAAAASSRAPRSVVATSPVTGRTYTMNCVAEGQMVVCTGGENAVVYVY